MQENLNTPPFTVGQEVVCIESATSRVDSSIKVEEGKVYRVVDIMKCNCGQWYVDVGVTLPNGYGYCRCDCGKYVSSERVYSLTRFFAPIQTQYTDITKELADSVKETVEAPDKILIPQTVNN